jgi:hypothetical protein
MIALEYVWPVLREQADFEEDQQQLDLETSPQQLMELSSDQRA